MRVGRAVAQTAVDEYSSFISAMARHLLEFQTRFALSGQAFSLSLWDFTIAALLPAHWAKRLADTNVRALTDSDLAWADVALVSGMLVQKDNLLVILARCRAARHSRRFTRKLLEVSHSCSHTVPPCVRHRGYLGDYGVPR